MSACTFFPRSAWATLSRHPVCDVQEKAQEFEMLQQLAAGQNPQVCAPHYATFFYLPLALSDEHAPPGRVRSMAPLALQAAFQTACLLICTARAKDKFHPWHRYHLAGPATPFDVCM